MRRMDTSTRENLDLSGEWQIAFDPQNTGLLENWQGNGFPIARSQPINVPEIWNLTFPDAEGVGFYRRKFACPESWKEKSVWLMFLGAMYRAEVWVNGQFAGAHEGGFTPFELEITSLAHFGGENILVVRVAALAKSRAVDGMLLQHAPLSKQGWYYVFGGLWGGVSLQARPALFCRSVALDPCLSQESLGVDLCLINLHPGCRQTVVRIHIRDPRGEAVLDSTCSAAVPPGEMHLHFTFRLPHLFPWSADEPHLYHFEAVVVEEDEQSDRLETRFGMRDFTVREGQFFLNGQPCYLQGVLLQPNYPIKLVEAPDRAMLEQEIRLVKQAGFNLIRVHLQPANPIFLDLADEMGMLVYAETSLGWIKDSPRLLDHGRREIREMIARDRNHPSVVFWGVYNENPTASAINGTALAYYARSLDPTRVIVEDSGGSLAIDQDFGWIDRAAMTPSWEAQSQKMVDVHLYLGSPTPNLVRRWLRDLGLARSSQVLVEERYGSPGVMAEFDREIRANRGMVFVSELGCGGMADLDEQVAGFEGRENLLDARELKTLRDSLREGFNSRRLERVFGSPKKLYQEAQALQAEGNTQQVEALLVNPRVSGYLITQLNDVAWEFHAGLLDLWRNPKPAYFAAARLTRLQVVVLSFDRDVCAAGEVGLVSVTLVNRQILSALALIELSAENPAGAILQSWQFSAPSQVGIHELGQIRFSTGEAGTYRVTARLLCQEVVLDESEKCLLAVNPVDWTELSEDMQPMRDLTEGAGGLIVGKTRRAAPIYMAARPGEVALEGWERLLSAVEQGARALVGPLLPEHLDALDQLAKHRLSVTVHPGIGSWMGCYHWAPQSDLFAGLPAGGILKTPFTNVLPKYVLGEMGGEVLAGSMRNTQSRREDPRMLWYSDIERVRLGQGWLVFCQYRIFDYGPPDAVAARMSFNLLNWLDRAE